MNYRKLGDGNKWSNLPSSKLLVLAHVAAGIINWMKTMRRETRINGESITQQSDEYYWPAPVIECYSDFQPNEMNIPSPPSEDLVGK